MTERTTAADLRLAAAGFERSLTAAEDQWDQQSPCTEWKASDVVDHVVGVMEVAARETGAMVPDVDDRGDRLRALVDGVAGAVDADPSLLDKPMSFSGEMQLPGSVLLGIFTTDMLVHTWDLGRAVGLDVELDEDLARRSLDGVRPMEQVIRNSPQFDPAVPVPDDAPVQDQLLGFLGRDPAWGR